MLTRRIEKTWDMTFGFGLANYAARAEAVAQSVRTRLQLIQGEWFLDTSAGVPYLAQICVKPANLPLAESLIKATILETEGVATLEAFDMTFDANTRRLNISATVTTIYGETTNIQTFTP